MLSIKMSRIGVIMKTKIIVLGLALALIPAVANAKTHKITSVNRYTYGYHRTVHIYCPFQGCKSSFSHYTGTNGYNN